MPHLAPYLVTLAAIALLCLMDAFMKSASLAVGAYSALLLRYGLALVLVAPVWFWRKSAWPTRQAMRVHLIRGVAITFMALTFFSALVRLPLAEAIAISFVSPLMALALAALILRERIGPKSIAAALLGIAGVAIIVAGRMGREAMTDDAALGVVLVLVSATLYAWNLILQRQQALLAGPLEIATFQAAITGTTLLLGAPFFFHLPEAGTLFDSAASSVLGLAGVLLLSWSYARAEAQVLVPLEYTGFAWAALFGWLAFGESVGMATLAGAALIVAGCWIAAPRSQPEQAAA